MIRAALLRDLATNQWHWFSELAAITRANAIPPEDAGNIPRMAEAWLSWAKENGYQWQ